MEFYSNDNLKESNKMLQTTKASPEHMCILCQADATLELENGTFICENCAQIQGELAELLH